MMGKNTSRVGEMRSVVPCGRDICEFCESCGGRDQGCYCASQGDSGPSHRGGRFELGLGGVNAGRVECSVVLTRGDTSPVGDDPLSLGVDDGDARPRCWPRMSEKGGCGRVVPLFADSKGSEPSRKDIRKA